MLYRYSLKDRMLKKSMSIDIKKEFLDIKNCKAII